MAEALGRILRDVQAMLDRHEVKLGAPFRELGADPDYDRAFRSDLHNDYQRLQQVDRRAFDAHRLNAYSAVQGTLRQLHDYVAGVVAQGRGSVDNTRQALALLAAAQAALKRLMALLGGGAEQGDGAGSTRADMRTPKLVKLLLKKYDETDLYRLASSLGISGDDLDETTKRSLARTLVEKARERDKYRKLLEMVRQEHPESLL